MAPTCVRAFKGDLQRRFGLVGLKGEVQVGCLEKFFLSKSSEALEQTAYGGSGVTIPGGVQKLWRCGTWAVGMVEVGWDCTWGS